MTKTTFKIKTKDLCELRPIFRVFTNPKIWKDFDKPLENNYLLKQFKAFDRAASIPRLKRKLWFQKQMIHKEADATLYVLGYIAHNHLIIYLDTKKLLLPRKQAAALGRIIRVLTIMTGTDQRITETENERFEEFEYEYRKGTPLPIYKKDHTELKAKKLQLDKEFRLFRDFRGLLGPAIEELKNLNSKNGKVTPSQPDRLLTPNEAAAYLGIPERTLSHWRSKQYTGRKGPKFKKGTSRSSPVRYSLHELERWQRSRVFHPP